MVFFLLASVAAAQPEADSLLGYWSSITKIDVEITRDAAGALRVVFNPAAAPQACEAAAELGELVTCSTPGGDGRFVHTFRIVDGDILLDRLSGSIPADAVPAVAFVRRDPASVARIRLAAKEAALARNLESLVKSELAYEAAFDDFVPCALWPRDMARLDAEAVLFEGAGATPGFARLGFTPYGGASEGSFSVEISPDRAGFTAHAWADLDGDGKPQHWTATNAAPEPRRVTMELVR